MAEEKLQILENLVEELLKDAPREETVLKFMSKAGLAPQSDPNERIKLVLQALNFEHPDKEILE